MTKFPCSAYISPRERLQLTCCVVIHLASCPGAKGACKALCALEHWKLEKRISVRNGK